MPIGIAQVDVREEKMREASDARVAALEAALEYVAMMADVDLEGDDGDDAVRG